MKNKPLKLSFDNHGPLGPPSLGLQDPMIMSRTDICPFCNSQQIELFSFNGYAQNYKYAVNDFIKGNQISFDKYEIRSMKCRACGKEFVIDWINGGMPVPLKDPIRGQNFLQEFILGI